MRDSNNGGPDPTGRRRFITSLTAAGMALPFMKITPGSFLAPEGGRPVSISVFSKPLIWLDYDSMSSLLAEAGADGIDLTVRPQGHVLPENVETDLPRAIASARRKGLKVDMIVTSILTAGDKTTEKIISTAASEGVKYYRLGWFSWDDKLGINGTLDRCRKELDKISELNRKYKIHGAYQNHAGNMVGAAVWDVWEMLKNTDPEYTGCQYDIRHAVAEGSESWQSGLKLLAPWIKCSDIKDFTWSEHDGKWNPVTVPLGEGIVPFPEYFKLIKTLNITGPESLHFEYPPFENGDKNLTSKEKGELFLKYIKQDIDRLRNLHRNLQG